MAATIAALASYAASAASAVGAAGSAAAGAVGSGLTAAGSALGLGGAAAPTGAGIGAGLPTLGGTGTIAATTPTLAAGVPSLTGGAAVPLIDAATIPASSVPVMGVGMRALGLVEQAADWMTNPGGNALQTAAKYLKPHAAGDATPDLGEMKLLGGIMQGLSGGPPGAPGVAPRRGNPGDLMAIGAPAPAQGYVVGPDGIIHWQGR